jgi:WD40 repeat protein
VKLWDVASGKELATLPGHEIFSTTALLFSGDGKQLVTGDGFGSITVWDLATRQAIASTRVHSLTVKCLALAPDGRTIASAGASDRSLKLWDFAGAKQPVPLTQLIDILALDFTPDGKTLAVGRPDHTIQLWDVASKQMHGVLKGHTREVGLVRFTPDGGSLISAAGTTNTGHWVIAGEIKRWQR